MKVSEEEIIGGVAKTLENMESKYVPSMTFRQKAEQILRCVRAIEQGMHKIKPQAKIRRTISG